EETAFTEIRQVLDALAYHLGMELTFKETTHSSFVSGRVAEIISHNHSLGLIGEIHPQVLSNWNLTMPVAVFEIKIEKK
ncbi:MAG: phenylalanine--tRNA ligase subunit beta, partial [Nanoarchaeota archaeon]